MNIELIIKLTIKISHIFVWINLLNLNHFIFKEYNQIIKYLTSVFK